MLLHTVMWHFIDAEGKTKEENRAIVKEGLLSLPHTVKELLKIEFFENAIDCERNFDAMLKVYVEDAEALERYKVHPEHQKVAAYVKKVTDNRAAVDIFVDSLS